MMARLSIKSAYFEKDICLLDTGDNFEICRTFYQIFKILTIVDMFLKHFTATSFVTK